MTTILTKDVPDFSVAFTVDGNMVLTRNEKIDVAGLSMNQIGAMLAIGYNSEIVSPDRLLNWAQEYCDAREDDIKRLIDKEIAQVYCFKFLVADGDGWVSRDEFVNKAKVGTRFLINCTRNSPSPRFRPPTPFLRWLIPLVMSFTFLKWTTYFPLRC